MKGIIVFIGFVVLIAGIIIAFSNPIDIYHPAIPEWEEQTGPGRFFHHSAQVAWTETIYPYAIAGGIVCLIGVISVITGLAIPKYERQEVTQLTEDSET